MDFGAKNNVVVHHYIYRKHSMLLAYCDDNNR